MMRPAQSRSDSFLEAATNVALGFLLALATQGIVYPLFGIDTTLATDSTIALIFTAVSLIRSYLVRRAFETFGCTTARCGRRCPCAAVSPKPTHLKVLDGNPGRRPLNPGEPRPQVKVPTCPQHLSPTAKHEWKRLAHQLHVLGILTASIAPRWPPIASPMAAGSKPSRS